MYDLIVIGAGPAGLSAASHAHKNNMSVLVLEKGEIANTLVYDYQKGKYVMAEPPMIPLRSDVPFEAGVREPILESWQSTVVDVGLSVHCAEEVRSIEKTDTQFTVKTSKAEYSATHVILAIGVQGNPRMLDAPGATLPHVSTRLVDPSIYVNEDILVLGGGDAAIEKALALSLKNRVSVVYRKNEFFRLKDALDRQIKEKISSKRIRAFFSSEVVQVEEQYAHIRNVIKPDSQPFKVKADLIFVSFGAEMPRTFLEKNGIQFASTDPNAPPILTKHFETTVPGLFMIGSVAGYGLIKQGMNQGYDVVERLLGHEVEPVEEPILRDERLGIFDGTMDERLAELRALVPLLGDVSDQAIREVLLASTVYRDVQPKTLVYREEDYSDSLYIILRGYVQVKSSAQAEGEKPAVLEPGDFFGEMSLVTGQRRAETVKSIDKCVLMEIPRRAVLRLLNSDLSAKRAIDQSFSFRALQLYLLPQADRTFLRSLASRAKTCAFKQGEVVIKAGDPADALYLVRSGSMKVSKQIGIADAEVVVNHLPVGKYFGEAALLDSERSTHEITITATKLSEAVRIKKKDFKTILDRYPEFRQKLNKNIQETMVSHQVVSSRDEGHLVNRLMDMGVFEGTDVLFIDENTCVRCDQCVNACANTHNGQTRLYRTEGTIVGNLLVPTACQHCEHPMCMTDCPPGDAIVRDPNGEVFIHQDRCIGCGNCATNCPYDSIFMVHRTKAKELGAFDRLKALVGLGGERMEEDKNQSIAIKCDLCKDVGHGPACVNICPTGAAFRVFPNNYFKKLGVGGSIDSSE